MTTLFYQPQIPDGMFILDTEESRHCIKVLRKKTGDLIFVTDGKGIFYECIITKADAAQCAFDIRHQQETAKKNFFIHVAISPTKNADRIEWFVEKATELGIDQISFIECKNTERSFIKTERMLKVAVSAMKQSMKAVLPVIGNELLQFTEVVENCQQSVKCIGFVDATNPVHLKDVAPPRSSYCILIGPEGDFSSDELKTATDRGFKKVTLGQSRLRTETAGIAGCHILNLINS
jgi:16S rRNA (uracil1498-N3)-methyltransferase